MRYLAAAVSMVILFCTPVFPEVFTWTDGNGTENFTDDISRIPAKYRKKATPLRGLDDDCQVSPPEKKTPQAAECDLSGESAMDDANVAGKGTEARRRRSLQGDGSRVAKLTRMLLKDGQSERDKAYAAFSWIGTSIVYDHPTKWQRRYGNHGADQSPEGVLASGRGVCEGIANTFAAVTQKMGLESMVITGRASGARQERHAWNAVKIDGKWGLVDITRHTFLATPQEFLARHFPDDPRWQLLDRPLTYEEWLKR